MKLSVILVNWKTRDITRDALVSIYKETRNIEFEVIVVDNNSQDGSVEMIKKEFPQVILIENSDNRGFGKANNQGLKIAKGDYLMFLNTDVVVLDHAIEKLVNYLDTHADVMMVGPRLLNRDLTFQHVCRRMLPNPTNSFFHLFGLTKIFKNSKFVTDYKQYLADPEVTGPAQALSGAAMMFRKAVYEQIGGFDETFFMYGEDLDFCKRVLDKGWKTVYVSEAKIIHFGGQSSGKRWVKSLINFYEAMWLYYRKHFYNQHNIILNLIIWMGIKVRMAIALLINYLK
ncbi:MAG: glycosyltransferase family 2 protein [Candidatus Magasanikbacteria bacterium]|nr:glycosyltransferase family 2 protein [Candidatus Magasanikbacteria bacterium]